MARTKQEIGKIILDNITKEKKVTWIYDAEREFFITEQELTDPKTAAFAYNKFISRHNKNEKAHVDGEKVAIKDINKVAINKIKPIEKRLVLKHFVVKNQEARKDKELTPLEIVNANFGGNNMRFSQDPYNKNRFITTTGVRHPRSGLKSIKAFEELKTAKATSNKQDGKVVITLDERSLKFLSNTTRAQKLTLSHGFQVLKEEISMSR